MQSFSVGTWRVQPAEGTLTRGDIQKRLQPKVMQVLLSLAQRPGELVTREELLRDVWGERAVSDEPLTRCIAELRSAFEDSASAPNYIETLPKRGYRLIAELTPDVAPGQAEERAAPVKPRWRRTLAGILAAAVLAVAGGSVWQAIRNDSGMASAPTPPSVAVLPFVNLSGDPGQEFLADGISETLTQVLSRNAELKVVARTSAFAFKGQSVDVREIGARLGVGALLEGSVQRDGSLLRITAQLVDSETGISLWSDAFDRPANELFELQDEIAADVATALQVALLDAVMPTAASYGAADFDAYLAYAHGLEGMRLRTTASLATAIEEFRAATARDPSFALAWVALAEALLVNQWYADVPLDQSLDQAQAAIDRALALDPNLGEAWAVIGLMEFKRANYAESERALKKAVALVPNNARAWFQYGTLLNDTGRPAEAIEKHRMSAQLDPLAPVVLTAIGVSLEKLGRFEEALEQYRKVSRVDPDYPAAHDRIGMLAWGVFGRADLALAAHREALRLDTDNTWTRSLVAEMALGVNDVEMATAWVDAALETGGSKLYPNQSRAYLMAFRDDEPRERLAFARRWLDDAFTYVDIDVMLRLCRDAALELGKSSEALALYREFLPALFEPDTEMTTALFGPAIDAAYLLKRNGRDEEADRLLGEAWGVIAGLPRNGCCGYGIADVEILAISGRGDEAVARLTEAYESGFRQNWWWHTGRNPNLDSLQDRKDYQDLIGRFVDRAGSERAMLPRDRLP